MYELYVRARSFRRHFEHKQGTMRGTTAACLAAAASALLLAKSTAGEEDGGHAYAGGALRKTAATIGINKATVQSRNKKNNANGLVTLPLIPHRTMLDRRRRERRLQGKEEEDSDTFADYDEVPSDGYPRRRLTEPASRPGGRVEVMSLYQGFGTHYVDLWVGTPPQRQTVIVDTGSGVTAFPCSLCHDCGDEKYHTDPIFREDESKSFSPVSCDQCSLGPCGSLGHGGLDEVCLVTMRYEEGSSWKAFEGKDWCYPGGPHDQALAEVDGKLELTAEEAAADGADPELAETFRFPLKFGCQTMLTGLFRTQLADGIMGMENAPTALWRQMYQSGVTKRKSFSLCYRRVNHAEKVGTEAGALTLGGSDARLHETPMVWAENFGVGNGWYSVHVEAVYIRASGGHSAAIEEPDHITKVNIDSEILNSGGIIVDSGTTDTYLQRGVKSAFQAAWKEATGQDLPVGGKEFHLDGGMDALNNLPTFIFQLRVASHLDPDLDAQAKDQALPGMAAPIDPSNPKDVLVAVPPPHYLTPVSDNGDWKLRMHFSEADGSGGVLGANVMLGHDVTIDLDNNRIGFAESNCDYDSLSGAEEEDQR